MERRRKWRFATLWNDALVDVVRRTIAHHVNEFLKADLSFRTTRHLNRQRLWTCLIRCTEHSLMWKGWKQTMLNVEHKATDFFGDSMQLQASPIHSIWNRNRIELLKSNSTRLYASLWYCIFWNRKRFLYLWVQKLRIGPAWSCVESYHLAWDCQHKKSKKFPRLSLILMPLELT